MPLANHLLEKTKQLEKTTSLMNIKFLSIDKRLQDLEKKTRKVQQRLRGVT